VNNIDCSALHCNLYLFTILADNFCQFRLVMIVPNARGLSAPGPHTADILISSFKPLPIRKFGYANDISQDLGPTAGGTREQPENRVVSTKVNRSLTKLAHTSDVNAKTDLLVACST